MGTSSAYDGPAGDSPLVPSWLGTGAGELEPMSSEADPEGEVEPAAGTLELDTSERFKAARSNFTRFARSGGKDGAALRRAMRSYVSTSSGGYRTATMRMGAALPVGMSLLGVLSDTVNRDAAGALRAFQLDQLLGSPIEDILGELMDRLCPSDGSIDSAISRGAFAETIAELVEAGLEDFAAITMSELKVIFGQYVAHTIELRVFNDIGTNGINVPQDHKAALEVQEQLHDFIFGTVQSAVDNAIDDDLQITEDAIEEIVREVYENTFDLLSSVDEEEGVDDE